jgi:ketosteroid isomerase-like protein
MHTTNAVEVGQQLVELCRQGRNLEAISQLYSPDIVSLEATEMPDYPAEVHGIDQVIAKNQRWIDTTEVHSASVDGPFPHNDRFAVKYHFDITPKVGPAAGQRFEMDEIAVYTVEDGKIVREEFFYNNM